MQPSSLTPLPCKSALNLRTSYKQAPFPVAVDDQLGPLSLPAAEEAEALAEGDDALRGGLALLHAHRHDLVLLGLDVVQDLVKQGFHEKYPNMTRKTNMKTLSCY